MIGSAVWICLLTVTNGAVYLFLADVYRRKAYRERFGKSLIVMMIVTVIGECLALYDFMMMSELL